MSHGEYLPARREPRQSLIRAPLKREPFMMRIKVLHAHHQRGGSLIAARSRSILRALVLCGLLGLATDPAWSQTQDQNVRLTMSKLPPHTSAAYAWRLLRAPAPRLLLQGRARRGRLRQLPT